jgi:hypothetical protein
MDDILTLIATTNPDRQSLLFHDYIQNHLYDQTHKLLTLKPQSTTKFLDTRITLHNNNKNVKIIYDNKNEDFHDTLTQNIGRYHHLSAPSLLTHKLSAAQSTLIRIHDYTTTTTDMIIPTLQILHEFTSLDYKPRHLHSILTKTNRSRPNPLWSIAAKLISTERMTDYEQINQQLMELDLPLN